ncbi:MAG: NADH-quinone oxidoreductase subunit L [Myxococcales bacterium]|nr:NADH-quinone oxidoreductase subunit L [Myxococcales bacterium]
MEALYKQFPPRDFALLAVVLAMPLVGAFVNGVFGKRLGKDAVRLMALSALGVSFLASVITFVAVPAEGGKLVWNAWHWLDISGRGGRTIGLDVAFGVDAMSATMMLVVTGVGFLIHLYSTEYMKDDPGFYRFFAYLNLFIFSMLVLIMGDNLPVLFVGWEGVGLCSYLLIGFWFSEEKNAAAGKKAFITNRIGDFGLLVAMAMLVYFCGTLTFDGIKQGAASGLLTQVKIWPLGNLPTEAIWDAQFASQSVWPKGLVHLFLPEQEYTAYASTLVGLALFLGCAGKSAQIPLYVWLPDAMAGPTPVSALIHAATMVTAGVYLVARMADVFVLSPFAMATVATVGALTAVFAASMGFFQKDLKKVLAYSTVSQLGFMFIGVGVGAFTAGFFHVFTHAFFKACLFLGAGSVIHAMHARIHDTDQSQSIENMGGLRKYMPITHATFLVSCLSIAGLPFVTAGFYSKDEILWKAWSMQVTGPGRPDMWAWPGWLGKGIYWVGIIGATMTAFYMFRIYFMTFHGEFRGWKIVKGWVDPHPHHAHDDGGHGHDDHGHGHDDHGHGHDEEHGKPMEGPEPHESPWQMTLPLAVLGAMAVLAGFLGAAPLHIEPLLHKLEPLFSKANKLIASTGHGGSEMWIMMAPGAGAFLLGTYGAYVIYFQKGGEPEKSFARSFPRFYSLVYDKWRIDELYDATVIGMVDALADIFTMADKWIIDGILAKLTSLVTQGIGAALRLFHTGRVQVYAASMVVGLLGMGWFFAQPHAKMNVNDSELKSSGKVVVSAQTGPGYAYKWTSEGVDQKDFSGKLPELQIVVPAGQTRDVTLTVRNAFGREAQQTLTFTRDLGKGAPAPRGTAAPGQPPGPPGQPGPAPSVIRLDGNNLPGFVRGQGQQPAPGGGQ